MAKLIHLSHSEPKINDSVQDTGSDLHEAQRAVETNMSLGW